MFDLAARIRRLVGSEGCELDVRSTAARPGHRRVQLLDRLVRRDEHEHAQALADEAVDDVEKT